MIRKIIQGARTYAWHLSSIMLIIGLIWAGIGVSLWHDYHQAERQAQTDAANLAQSFDENITRTVEAVDQTLLFVREAWRHDHSVERLGSWTTGATFLSDLRVQIGLAGRDGDVIWSNLGPVEPGINLSDREHFQVQQNSHEDSLFISRPVLGRVSGKWTIQFVRKLLAADGSFDGIVVVSLDPAYLSRFYGSISIGQGAIMLATASGIVLARAPDNVPILGRDLSPEVTERIIRQGNGGTFRVVSSIDGIERIVSARTLDRYKLLVTVGLASEDVFAAYRRGRSTYIGAGILLSVVCVLVSVAMGRQRQSLLLSRHALSVTLENMSQGIVMVRSDGRIPVCNNRAIELLGLPGELMATRPTFQQIIDWQRANHEFGPSVTPALRRAGSLRRQPEQPANYTYERTRPNGSVLEVRTQALADGGFVRTFTDVTERRNSEAALAAAQARAAHAERMQALGQLAGGIAHDFNNILQAVQGSAALIDKRAADPGSVRRFAGMILDATERGGSITRRLLAFARRGELRAEAIDPYALLPGLRDVLSHTLGSAITVELRLAQDLPMLLADKGQLETALVNLATNARDAMPGGGTLTFTATAETVAAASHAAEPRPGCYVRLSIADTGTGIDPATLARVLEPFFSTKPPSQGTGLGLSMAKGFAEQSGGALTIDSTLGLGTTVHLWLPVTTRGIGPAIAPSLAPPRPAGHRILLVDDEAMVRETLAIALEDAGYTVLTAGDGAEALTQLRSGTPFDILVTDLSMPGLDGLAVIRAAQQERPDLPAVLLTGYAGHGADLAVGETVSGTFSLLRKPVTAGQLADRIEALLAVTLAG